MRIEVYAEVFDYIVFDDVVKEPYSDNTIGWVRAVGCNEGSPGTWDYPYDSAIFKGIARNAISAKIVPSNINPTNLDFSKYAVYAKVCRNPVMAMNSFKEMSYTLNPSNLAYQSLSNSDNWYGTVEAKGRLRNTCQTVSKIYDLGNRVYTSCGNGGTTGGIHLVSGSMCRFVHGINVGMDVDVYFGYDSHKEYICEGKGNGALKKINPSAYGETLILSHKDVSSGFFDNTFPSTGIENPENPSANTFSIVGSIADYESKYQSEDGFYRFMLDYTVLSNNKNIHIEWKQSSWIAQPNIIGYVPINVPVQTTAEEGAMFSGLGKSSQPENTYLDGTGSDHLWWYNAVGAIHAYNNGFPCFNKQICKSVELNVLLPQDTSRFVCDSSVVYATFDGLGCTINGNECPVYQNKDVSKIIEISTGTYQIFWSTPFLNNKYSVFISSNINAIPFGGSTDNQFGFAQLGGNNDELSINYGVSESYATISLRTIGATSYTMSGSNYISVVATSNFFDMKMASFNGLDNSVYTSNVRSVVVDDEKYQVIFDNALPDDNYPIGITTNWKGTNSITGIYGNNIIGSANQNILRDSVKLDPTQPTNIDNGPHSDYISVLAGYPDIDVNGFNIKFVVFNGKTLEVYSSSGANIIRESSQNYKITWNEPFESNNYAVVAASNYLGTYGQQIAVHGEVEASYIQVGTVTLNGQSVYESDYISLIAFEFIGNKCMCPDRFYRQLCHDKQEVNGAETILSETALTNNIFFFSIHSTDPLTKNLLMSNTDFISIRFYPFKSINYASYMEIVLKSDEINVFRVDPVSNEKYTLLTLQDVPPLDISYDFWLQFSNDKDIECGFIKFGAGTTTENSEIFSFPFSSFVEDSVETASYRLSYESLKYMQIFYNSDIVIENDASAVFMLYKPCKNEDELNAFVNKFGFYSSDSGTPGGVSINTYVKNNIYSCTKFGVKPNQNNLCTNLDFIKYERCKHDTWRQLTGSYDYIMEIVVQNDDYLIIDKLLLDDYTIMLEKDVLLTNMNSDANNNKLVVGFQEEENNKNGTKTNLRSGVIIDNTFAFSGASPITFGISLTAIKSAEILIELFDDNNRYICNFIPSLLHNNNGESINYLCVDNVNKEEYINDNTYNYVSYALTSCISDENYANTIKITIDSDKDIEIDNIFINDKTYNKFCGVGDDTLCLPPNDAISSNGDSCEYLTNCIDVGIASLSRRTIRPIIVISNIFNTNEDTLKIDKYNTLYKLSITTCNTQTPDNKMSILLKGILGSSQREILSLLPSASTQEYRIGSTPIGTFFSIQFEADGNTDICLSGVELIHSETNEILFKSDIGTIGKGIWLQKKCNVNYKSLTQNIYIPCFEKVFVLEKFNTRLHTKLSMELCSGENTEVGLDVSSQEQLYVALTGLDANDIFRTTDTIFISSDDDWTLDDTTAIREYNILYDDYDVKSLSVVFIGNGQHNPICIDKVIINNQKAILNNFWICSDTPENPSDRPCSIEIPAVLSWPICSMEIIDTKTILKDTTEGTGETLSGSCTNWNRFSNIECSTEKAFAFEASVEWTQELSRAQSQSFEIAEESSSSETGEVGASLMLGVESKISALVAETTLKAEATVHGSKSWTSSSSTVTTSSRGTEITTVTSASGSKSESTEIHCAASVDLGPYQKVNYDIKKVVTVSTFQTETDFKLTKCSYILDEDDTNPDHFIYLMGVPGKVTMQEALSCNVQFYGTEYIQSKSKCNEAQKINAITLNTYVPFCNQNNNELWDPCQCETGDALTDQTCFCVDPATGMMTDAVKATATDNSVTTWKTWCSQNCAGTQFQPDSTLVDINGNPLLDIVSGAQTDNNVIPDEVIVAKPKEFKTPESKNEGFQDLFDDKIDKLIEQDQFIMYGMAMIFGIGMMIFIVVIIIFCSCKIKSMKQSNRYEYYKVANTEDECNVSDLNQLI
eukprot:60417_1